MLPSLFVLVTMKALTFGRIYLVRLLFYFASFGSLFGLFQTDSDMGDNWSRSLIRKNTHQIISCILLKCSKKLCPIKLSHCNKANSHCKDHTKASANSYNLLSNWLRAFAISGFPNYSTLNLLMLGNQCKRLQSGVWLWLGSVRQWYSILKVLSNCCNLTLMMLRRIWWQK